MNYEKTINDIIKEIKGKFKERLLTDDCISHITWYINQYNAEELRRLLKIVEYKMNSYIYRDSYSLGAYGLSGMAILATLLVTDEVKNSNLIFYLMILLVIIYFCILIWGFNYTKYINKNASIEKKILEGLKIAVEEKISEILIINNES